jgi:hypothetical protein
MTGQGDCEMKVDGEKRYCQRRVPEQKIKCLWRDIVMNSHDNGGTWHCRKRFGRISTDRSSALALSPAHKHG